jgi:phage shock protein C
MVDFLCQTGLGLQLKRSFCVYCRKGEQIKMSAKKLYRNPNDQMIAGVCSGLADYFNIDKTIVRLIFVLLFFLGSHGILVYLILWIVMPVRPPYLEGEILDDQDKK